MSLSDKLAQQIKTAIKGRDKVRLRGLRAIKSAVLLAKTDGSGEGLNEAKEIKMLQKLIKQRQDSLTIFEQQNREDLAVKEREEIEVIQEFLPEQMGAAELEQIISKIIAETGASSMRDMGKVMGKAAGQLKGKADNKTISTMVKGLLSK